MTALAVVLALIAGYALGTLVMWIRNQQIRYSHTLLETDLYARKDATSLNDENTP